MKPAQVPPAVRHEVRRLAALPPRALPRIAADLLAWVVLGWFALHVHPLLALPIAFLIGFVPMHDLLIHGHEAVHRLASRVPVINEFLLWFLHALFGVSGTAHRAFHLSHHRWTHEPRDPEYGVLRRLGGTGTAYVLLPWVAPLGVYHWIFTWPQRPNIRFRTVVETIGAGGLHLALVLLLGPLGWATVVLLPIVIGLLPAFAYRSIGEHHGSVAGDPWKYAGTLDGGGLGSLWSNIDHHLEHHLFPTVPTRYMPELRAALREEYARNGVVVRSGWWGTFVELVRRREHFRAC